MTYNRFLISTFIKVVLISVNSFLIIYFAGMEKRLFTITFLILILLLQIWQLYLYVSRTNRDLTRFLFYLRYGDTSLHFSTDQIEKIFKGLSKSFNQIIDDIHQIKKEKEHKDQFLKILIEHIKIGFLSYDKKDKILFFNKSAQELLGIKALISIKDLDKIEKGLFAKIRKQKIGTNLIHKISLNHEILVLSFHKTIIRSDGNEITLLTVQNLKNELEENELQSYQKLIRVMTHEMMNSLTPITTLTTSIKRSISDKNKIKPIKLIEQETIDDAYTSSEIIEERSKGLIDFIQKYRTLTKLPNPEFKPCNVYHLFKKTIHLFADDINHLKIKPELESEPTSLEIIMDENLISQVLINLIKNSLDAIKQKQKKQISLNSYINDQVRAIIEVSDNGTGIDEAIKDDLFIPFFTTKEYGSGIGLNFCRQVMQLHKGSISVKSKKGEGSTFTLEF